MTQIEREYLDQLEKEFESKAKSMCKDLEVSAMLDTCVFIVRQIRSGFEQLEKEGE